MSHVDKQQTTYPLHSFKYNPENRIFYPPTYNESEYSYSDGRRVEDYIHSSIRGTNDVSDGSPELLSKIKDWPTYYHFSIERTNIFRCLDINPNSKVIEFGAGCGAITRYLGENFSSVDSVEGSKKRAQITRDRCRNLDNVKVFCSNIEDIQLNPEYDIATLIGVLEYAPVYFSDNQSPNRACLNLLKLARNAIKENGTLILAIENKIGLKYWSGCPEDHTGILYEGLHGYPNQVEPVTFSKKEIVALLEAAGFSNCVVLGCFPDYKFASTIINNIDDSNNYYLHNWIGIPFTAYNVTRKYSFHEGLALRTLSEAGLLGECANSFLILASSGNSASIGEIDWVATKISAGRRKELRCQTTLKLMPQIHIEKKRLYGGETDVTLTNAELKLHHRVSDATWIAGDTLLDEIYVTACNKGSYKIIGQLLARYYEETLKKYATGVSDEQGYPLLKGTSIDFIPRNIIKNNGTFEPIDEEWIIEGNIPTDYLLYRFLMNDFFGSQRPWIKKNLINTNYISIKLIRAIFPQYGLKRHMKNIEYERSFQYLVTGGINYRMPRQSLRSYIMRFAANFLK